MPDVAESFHVHINGGEERVITVRTASHRDAAAAALAMLGVNPNFPIRVEIWAPRFQDRRHYVFVIEEDQHKRLVIGPA